ncbi:MAG: mandelate racemase/muconate lactonizing enzyme family protein [Candidatus Bathyarchaeia archaeon]
MKIIDVRTIMVTVPFSTFGNFEPVRMWYQTRYADIHPVVFIDTDEGITGVGTQGDEYIIKNILRPRLIGQDPFQIEKIESELSRTYGLISGRWDLPTDTVAAIDNALWDIVGKACGQPLYRLWGGKVHDKIHVRYWMGCKSPEEQAEEAVMAVERGWRAFKIKLGTDPRTDLERVRQIRDAVGGSIELCFDINGGYPLSVAINTIKKMARYEPASIEDPVPSTWPYDPGCLDNMADIRRITGVPIEAHSHGPNCQEYTMALIQKRAADALHLNVSFVGSILECKRICAIAEAGGLIVTGQSTCAELGPRNAFMLHFIASERSFKGTNDSSTHHLEPPSGDIIKEEFRTVNGTLSVPDKPGLGVDIDPVKLDKYHQIWKSGKYQHEAGLGRSDPYLWF